MDKAKIKSAIEKTIRYMNGNYYSKFKEIDYFDTKIKVNSHHKQTLERSNYFKAVGYSDDGLIEAVEGEGDFQIGVQWHPERMLDFDEGSVKLFKAFLNYE